MRNAPLFLAAAALLASACASGPRAVQRLPPGTPRKVALRTVANKSQQFGLEDALMLKLRDEFLKDGTIQIVPEAEASGIVSPTITRYTLTPVQYDSALTPTAYKLDIIADLQFLDRATNAVLWEERDMDVFEIYPTSALTGGKTEQQAQADLWDELARDIVTRVVEGFAAR